jgi:hypothetical protein
MFIAAAALALMAWNCGGAPASAAERAEWFSADSVLDGPPVAAAACA